jgi:FkbM family methyltransferase
VSGPFEHALHRALLHDSFETPVDTIDHLRFPLKWKNFKERLRYHIDYWLRTKGYYRAGPSRQRQALDAYHQIHAMLPDLDATYAAWADDASRTKMVALAAYRILGPERVRLWTVDGHAARVQAALATPGVLVKRDTHRVGVVGEASLYDLHPLDVPVKLHAHALHVVNTFVLKQYAFRQGRIAVAAEPGDVVLDCGACWGDSTLDFAHRVGDAGRVIAFEFIPSNLAILNKNLDLNPKMKPRVVVVPQPVWSATGIAMDFDEGGGPGGQIVAAANAKAITTTIDETVAKLNLTKVDFIKMDIEGAEAEALRGAAATLARFRPKLAISAYHKADDLATLPKLIREQLPEYKLHLDHVTIHGEETVIFANAR